MAKFKSQKKDINVEESIEQQVSYYHIYDFLIRCKINRSAHDILHKKFEGKGLKSQEEWESLTKLKMA